MEYPEFLILRHGETVWNRQGRMQGGLDSPLTETGVAQAERQRGILSEFDLSGWRWFVSPQGRATHTARIASRDLTGTLRTDSRLREIGMGAWTGRMRNDLMAEAPHLFEGDGLGWYDHAPDGEGLVALETRCRDFLADMPGPAVIITHGITSRVMRCLALGRPVEKFDQLTGGQGVVYHVRAGNSRLLS